MWRNCFQRQTLGAWPLKTWELLTAHSEMHIYLPTDSNCCEHYATSNEYQSQCSKGSLRCICSGEGPSWDLTVHLVSWEPRKLRGLNPKASANCKTDRRYTKTKPKKWGKPTTEFFLKQVILFILCFCFATVLVMLRFSLDSSCRLLGGLQHTQPAGPGGAGDRDPDFIHP